MTLEMLSFRFAAGCAGAVSAGFALADGCSSLAAKQGRNK